MPKKATPEPTEIKTGQKPEDFNQGDVVHVDFKMMTGIGHKPNPENAVACTINGEIGRAGLWLLPPNGKREFVNHIRVVEFSK